MTAGDIYTVAGIQSRPQARGQHGPGCQGVARPHHRRGAAGQRGNLVIPDNGENDVGTTIAPTVRVVAVRTGTFYGQKMTAGHIYRVAGNGELRQCG